MTTNPLDGITSLLELIDLNKCLDYITFEIEGKTYKVRVVGTCEDHWFCGKDVCEILGYSNKKKALQQHVKSECKRILSEFSQNEVTIGQNNLTTDYSQGRVVYISKKGLMTLLVKSRNHHAPQILKVISDFLGISVEMFFHYSSKEQETIGVLKQAFSHIEQESQFAIGHYWIDLYLPKQKIAVECDENGHADRDPMAERERETYIKII
jgi:hypothetical protein